MEERDKNKNYDFSLLKFEKFYLFYKEIGATELALDFF